MSGYLGDYPQAKHVSLPLLTHGLGKYSNPVVTHKFEAGAPRVGELRDKIVPG
jgi:hypothetical protein